MHSLTLDTPELALTYDQISDKQYEHGLALLRALRIRPGDMVLDIGCGTGRLGDYLAREVVGPTGAVYSIDPLPLRIDIARRRAAANHFPSIGRGENLSEFANGSFDVIYLNNVYDWLPEKAPVLKEAHRLLKPGGRLGLSTAAQERPHAIQRLLRSVLAEHQLVNKANAVLPFGVSTAQLAVQLENSRFLIDEIKTRRFEDSFADADAVLEFKLASSFGNFLTEYSSATREAVFATLRDRLNAQQDAGGIRFYRYLLFTVASKASVGTGRN